MPERFGRFGVCSYLLGMTYPYCNGEWSFTYRFEPYKKNTSRRRRRSRSNEIQFFQKNYILLKSHNSKNLSAISFMLKRGNSGDSQVRDKKNLSKGILNRNLKKPDNYQLSTLRKALCNEGKHYVRLNPKKRKDLSIPCCGL